MANTSVYIEDEMLKKADEMARVLGLSRSEFFSRLVAMATLEQIQTWSVRLAANTKDEGDDDDR